MAEVGGPEGLELPEWMQPQRSALDWGLLVVVAFAILMAWPLVTCDGLPNTGEIGWHVFLAAELQSSIRQGVLYPRWAPELFGGYGGPIFNYRGAFAEYLAALYDLLTGSNMVGGIRFVLTGSVVVAGGGMYAWARRRWGAECGITAALVYLAGPHLAHAAELGDPGEVLAMAMFPAAMWALDRLAEDGRGRYAMAGALFLAVLLMSDNAFAFVIVAVLVVRQLWNTVVTGSKLGGLVPVAFVLGVGLASFFWMPALLEMGAVRWILGGVEPWSPISVQIRPESPTHLGLGAAMIAFLGLLALATGRAERRGRAEGLFWGVVLALALLSMHTVASDFWPSLHPSIRPTSARPVMGIAYLGLSVLAGMGVTWLREVSTPMKMAIMVAAATVIVLPALPIGVGADWDALWVFPYDAIMAYLGDEIGPPPSEPLPLPATVRRLSEPAMSLLESYAEGSVDRVDRDSLGPGVRVDVIDYGPTLIRLSILSTRRFTLRLYTLAFDGWTATVDGIRAGVYADEPEGFISIEVPWGSHQVAVYLSMTPPRNISWIASFVSMIGILVFWATIEYQGRGRSISPRPLLDVNVAAALAILAAVFSIVLALASPG